MNNKKAKAIRRLVNAHDGIEPEAKRQAIRILKREYSRHRHCPALLAGIQTYQRALSLDARVRAENIIAKEYESGLR